MKRFILTTTALISLAVAARSEDISLTVAEARSQAVEFNRTYLSAKEDVSIAEGEIAKARSGALPTIRAHGNYVRNFDIPKAFIQAGDSTIAFQFGFKNSFGAGISIDQPLFEGGKIFTAYSIAKDYKRYSQAVAEQVRAEVIYHAEVLFYRAVLAQSHLAVLEKALEANAYNLEVIEKMYSQGLVSQFEVLRARVEKNNLLPQILAAESELRLSKSRLKAYLGIELDKELTLRDQADDTSLASRPAFADHVEAALAGRPEVIQTDLLVDMTRKAVRVARGEYYPSLSAFAAFDWQSTSDEFSLKDNTTESVTAGLEVTIPIYQGGRRGGAVGQAVAEHNQAKYAQRQVADNIRLEVEAAYDVLLQARKALDIQSANIAEADEGLRIANVRYESGVGTLLEVLSAQVAATDARNAQAEAWFAFREARSRLKKASTLETYSD